MKYFKQFPTITYDNHQVKNILARVKLTELLKNERLTYFDYQLDDGDQPWIIADQYYDDPNRAWLVYMSNDIIDPVYEWYMDTYTFQNYITKKYGSLATAKAQIDGYSEVVDGVKTGTIYSTDTYVYSNDVNKVNWTPIYAYDAEDEKNEARRDIKLLNKKYVDIAESNLKALLKQ